MLTAQDVKKIAKDEDVRFLRMSFTDALGALKNIEIPVSLLDDALNNEIKIDGSSIDGFLPIERADMYLYPDPSSFVIYPWTTGEDKTAALICDVYNVDGTPFAGDPRGILKKNLAAVKKMGFDTLNIGAEPEFFLFKRDENGQPTMEVNDQANYFDTEPKDEGEACRRDIAKALSGMGFSIEAAHHEVAPGQHEIDFRFDDALHTADKIQYFKLVVREIAKQHGLAATFMPKPVTGINGSGMHFNQSLFKGGKNAFDDANGFKGLSKTALSYLAGLLKHAPAFTAVANPTINSYKRLVPGYEAPTYIAWATDNRTPLVRIPAGRGKVARLELRSGDPSANPYTFIAAILAAGADGIENDLEAPAPVERNIYKMTAADRDEAKISELPGSLDQAIANLEDDDILVDALGKDYVQTFVAFKKAELADYKTNVTSWEHKKYFGA
ncbi:type I glutamate--ammonia ligase [Limosilactobacillus caecicola]|uniref:type I glutamate--ammonia ligase n=1 Tax=Limosilactobacillus caecicola TaxID=2941332 RepID=UPI003898DA70